MKIMLLTWNLSISGGAQRQFLQLAKNARMLGYDVRILSYSFDSKACFPDLSSHLDIGFLRKERLQSVMPLTVKDNFFVKFFKVAVNIFSQNSEKRLFARYVNSQLKEHSPDCINIHDSDALYLAKHIKSVNIIWMMNDIHPIIDTFERGISTFQNVLFFRYALKAYAKILIYEYIWNVRKIITLDRRNQKLVEKYFSRNAEVVTSGLDMHNLNYTPINWKSHEINFLTVNIFYPYRRYEDSILAFANLLSNNNAKNLYYHIVGSTKTDKEYANRIVSIIQSLKIQQHVIIHNEVSDSELFNIYSKAHIYVFPNHNQTWGLSVFEAMSHSLPCIVSSTVGATDVLTNKENALIYEACNIDALYSAMKTLLYDHRVSNSIAKNSYNFVRKNLSWEKYARQMLDVFLA